MLEPHLHSFFECSQLADLLARAHARDQAAYAEINAEAAAASASSDTPVLPPPPDLSLAKQRLDAGPWKDFNGYTPLHHMAYNTGAATHGEVAQVWASQDMNQDRFVLNTCIRASGEFRFDACLISENHHIVFLLRAFHSTGIGGRAGPSDELRSRRQRCPRRHTHAHGSGDRQRQGKEHAHDKEAIALLF